MTGEGDFLIIRPQQFDYLVDRIAISPKLHSKNTKNTKSMSKINKINVILIYIFLNKNIPFDAYMSKFTIEKNIKCGHKL